MEEWEWSSTFQTIPDEVSLVQATYLQNELIDTMISDYIQPLAQERSEMLTLSGSFL